MAGDPDLGSTKGPSIVRDGQLVEISFNMELADEVLQISVVSKVIGHSVSDDGIYLATNRWMLDPLPFQPFLEDLEWICIYMIRGLCLEFCTREEGEGLVYDSTPIKGWRLVAGYPMIPGVE